MVDIKVDIPGLEKLIDVVASGVGAVTRPWLRKRDARTDHEVERIHFLGRRETDELRKRLVAGPLAEVTEAEIVEELPIPLLAERVHRRVEFQEAKRQWNIEDVVGEARADIERDPQVSPEPVDEDWTARFFGHAQDVSSEDMKKLWGRILAGEVRAPGSFSMRTLDVVRNLTKQDAARFEEVAPYLIDNQVVAAQNEFVGDLPFATYMTLVDADLMGPTQLARSYFGKDVPGPARLLVRMADLNVILAYEQVGRVPTWEVPIFPLTEAGRQISRLLQARANRDHALWFCAAAARRYQVSIVPRNQPHTTEDGALDPHGAASGPP